MRHLYVLQASKQANKVMDRQGTLDKNKVELEEEEEEIAHKVEVAAWNNTLRSFQYGKHFTQNLNSQKFDSIRHVVVAAVVVQWIYFGARSKCVEYVIMTR